jgi:hypothetical protein
LPNARRISVRYGEYYESVHIFAHDAGTSAYNGAVLRVCLCPVWLLSADDNANTNLQRQLRLPGQQFRFQLVALLTVRAGSDKSPPFSYENKEKRKRERGKKI